MMIVQYPSMLRTKRKNQTSCHPSSSDDSCAATAQGNSSQTSAGKTLKKQQHHIYYHTKGEILEQNIKVLFLYSDNVMTTYLTHFKYWKHTGFIIQFPTPVNSNIQTFIWVFLERVPLPSPPFPSPPPALYCPPLWGWCSLGVLSCISLACPQHRFIFNYFFYN